MFLRVVSLISRKILKYCEYYLEGEKEFLRFFFFIDYFFRVDRVVNYQA
jgi:NADH:ubiquinone oxidoreductase subunit 5 (subunit L)/multisubunit Na+/H+ antiporter MnhA subunit